MLVGQLTQQYGPLAHDFRCPYIRLKFEKPASYGVSHLEHQGWKASLFARFTLETHQR